MITFHLVTIGFAYGRRTEIFDSTGLERIDIVNHYDNEHSWSDKWRGVKRIKKLSLADDRVQKRIAEHIKYLKLNIKTTLQELKEYEKEIGIRK